MNKIVKIDSLRSGKVAFTYENGERLSIVFDRGTYSDNQFMFPERPTEELYGNRRWESTTVEVFGADGEQINKYLEEHYGQAPAAYVPVNDIPEIMAYVGSLEVAK